MADFTETTEKGCLTRITESVGGAVIGFLLFAIAFPLLFWNEGRAVKRAKDLAFGKGAVVKVEAKTPNKKNDGELVHVSGQATPTGKVADATFGIEVDAIKLQRSVEMYQWKETKKSKTKKKAGGGEKTETTYSYDTEWSSSHIDSGSFKKKKKHKNPASMPYEDKTSSAKGVALGGFQLGEVFIGKMSNYETLPPKKKYLAASKLGKKAKIKGEYFFIGKGSLDDPDVGDVRVKFQVVNAGPFSVVGGQTGADLDAFTHKDLNGSIELLQAGKVSPAKMFEAAETENTVMTWILRLVGWLMMFGGLRLLFKPLSVMADVIPFVGSFVEFGTTIVSAIISIAFALVTIAIAWVFYRPLLGIVLLLLGVGAIVGIVFIATKAAKAST